MIQDIAPYVYDNHYENCEPDASSYMILVKDNTTLALESDNIITFPEFSMFPEVNLDAGCVTYLFSISGKKFFLVEDDDIEQKLLDSGYSYQPLYSFRVHQPKHFSFAAITACHIATWYKEHKFCGCCGKPMEKDTAERMLRCTDCNIQEYPKISPAVIVAVTNGEKLLLSKYVGRLKHPYALIAGFAEVGESIEDTVRREVMEEVGLKVKNLRYYKSQPWSLSSSLLFGFYCELDGLDEIHLDKTELSLAEWVDRENLPVYEDDISLTYEMIAKFRDRMV